VVSCDRPQQRLRLRDPDPTVSTRHAELVRVDDGWAIRDLGSRNGTRVNGWLATEEPLHAGDTLTLGMTEFVFEP
jgi:pSer/pThr/pTyr-binding forkhead associated (FHA) protein